MRKEDITIIEIDWQGPYSFEEAKDFGEGSDFGLYQIYGTHNILGSNSLLYIGQANNQNLGTRLSQHKQWLNWEPSEMKIHVGRLGGTNHIDDELWEEQINHAERLLIYFSSPPYNSSNINGYGDIQQTLVLNFGKKNLLPFEVSTLYDESEYWESGDWKPYELQQ